MSTDFSGEVLSALDAFNEDFKQVQAGNGGAQRPAKGDWDCLFTKLEIDTKATTKLQDNQEIPAILITFGFAMVGGTSALPPEFKQGQEWPGRTFVLPRGGLKALPDSVTKGKRENFRIQMERLKGHLTVLLGANFTNNLAADLPAAQALLGEGKPAVAVRVRCQYTEDKKDANRHYFEEFLQKNLSAAS